MRWGRRCLKKWLARNERFSGRKRMTQDSWLGKGFWNQTFREKPNDYVNLDLENELQEMRQLLAENDEH
jgi:hypothetical protein